MATVTVGGGGRQPRTYELNKPSFVVGREPGCDIHIDNVAVSKKHCEFVNQGGTFLVRDLGSSNGTFIGTEKVTEHKLKDGEEVVIGSYSLRFENQAERHSDDAPVPTDGGDMMTLQLSPEMMRKKLEELKKEKAASGTTDKVMTAKEYGAQYSPPTSSEPAAPPANTKLWVGVFIGLIVVVWVIAIVIFMKK